MVTFPDFVALALAGSYLIFQIPLAGAMGGRDNLNYALYLKMLHFHYCVAACKLTFCCAPRWRKQLAVLIFLLPLAPVGLVAFTILLA
jgi:hypothetical protein